MNIFRGIIIFFITCFTIELKAQLDYGSYLGGSNSENITSTLTDKDGNTYFAGFVFGTNTPDLPVSSGSFRVKPDGSQDFFVYSLDPSRKIRWCTYLGTSGEFINEKIQIAFSKNSREGSLLVAFQSSKTGYALKSSCKSSPNGYDIVLLKFDLMGKQLLGTYYGGQKEENMGSMSVNSAGEILLTGSTSSLDSIATPNSYCSSNKTNSNATVPFFVKLDTNFNRSIGSYVIPNGLEIVGTAINVIGCWDVKKGFIIGFHTYSQYYNPSGGCYQNKLNGESDIFLSRFDNKGIRQWATYFGGQKTESIKGVICDSSNCYIYATTNSMNISDFSFDKKSDSLSIDLLIGAFDYNGVKKFVRYFGKNGNEDASSRSTNSITVFKQHIVIVGYTSSFSAKKYTSYKLSTDGAFKDSLISGIDGIIAIFNTSGQLKWSSYLGSFSDDYFNCIEIFNNRLLISGKTTSTSGISTDLALQESYSGGVSDGFLHYYKLPFTPSYILTTSNRQCLKGNYNCVQDNSWSFNPIISYSDTISDGQLFSKSYCFKTIKTGTIKINHSVKTADYSDNCIGSIYIDSMPKPKFNITLKDYDAFDNKITHYLSNQTDKINIKRFRWFMDTVFISADPLGASARTDLSKHYFKLIAEHINGCSDTASKLSQFVNSGISEYELDCHIKPNPFIDFFNIESTSFGIHEYEIVNTQGILVKKGVLNITSDVINLNNVNSGLYFLNIKGSPQIKLYKTQ